MGPMRKRAKELKNAGPIAVSIHVSSYIDKPPQACQAHGDGILGGPLFSLVFALVFAPCFPLQLLANLTGDVVVKGVHHASPGLSRFRRRSSRATNGDSSVSTRREISFAQ